MSSQSLKDNGVNGTGTSCEGASPGRGPVCEQAGLGRHLVTVSPDRNDNDNNTRKRRKKWTRDENMFVMECYFRIVALGDWDIEKECFNYGTIKVCLL